MYRAGICSILSQLAREDRLRVVESLTLEAPKTKLLAQKCKGMGLTNRAGDHRRPRRKPAARLAQPAERAGVEPRHADPVSLVFYKKVLITKAALAKIEEMLA